MSTTWGPTNQALDGSDYLGTWDASDPCIAGNIGGSTIIGGCSFLYNGDTITKADTIDSVYFVAYANAGRTLKLAVRMQSGSWAAWASGNKPSAATWANTRASSELTFIYEESLFGDGMTGETDLAADLATAIDADAGDQVENGDYINICIWSDEDTSDEYTSFAKQTPTLTITWTAAATGTTLTGTLTCASSVSNSSLYTKHGLMAPAIAGTSSVSASSLYTFHKLMAQAIAGVSAVSNSLITTYHKLMAQAIAGISVVSGNLSEIWENFLETLTGAITGVSVFAQSSLATLRNLMAEAIAGVSTFWGNLEQIGASVIETLTGAIAGVSEFGSASIETIRNLMAQAVAGTSSFVSASIYTTHNLMAEAVAGVSTFWGNLKEYAGAAANRFRVYMKIHGRRGI